MFWGKFLDGPLAGCAFELIDCGDSDGGLGSAMGPLFLIGVLATAVMILVVAPFIIWPVFFQEFGRQGGTLGYSGAVAVLGLQLIYCLLRMRRNVLYWKVSIIKELLLNMLFLFGDILACSIVFFGFFADEAVKEQLGIAIKYLPEIFEASKSNLTFGTLFGLLFILLAMSAIPVALNCIFSNIWIKKISKLTKVSR